MTKTTREIEKKMNENIFWMSIVMSAILMGFIVVVISINFQNQINQLPHKYCHNETSSEVVNLEKRWSFPPYDMTSRGMGEFDTYLCSDGIRVDDFRSIGTIWFNLYSVNNGTCILNHIKEVCEIK